MKIRSCKSTKVACRKNVYKLNGLFGEEEEEEEKNQDKKNDFFALMRKSKKKIRTKRKAFSHLCEKSNETYGHSLGAGYDLKTKSVERNYLASLRDCKSSWRSNSILL